MTFADFDADGGAEPWSDAEIRPMKRGDRAAVAAVLAEREGCGLERAAERVSRWCDSPDRLVLVAVHQGRVEGYGRAEWLDPEARGGRGPRGWYLAGLVVAPQARRHGLGARLTEERIRLLAEVTNELWYLANLRNRATLTLHERYGFVLHTRDFRIPGVSFAGGQGALFRLAIARRSPAPPPLAGGSLTKRS